MTDQPDDEHDPRHPRDPRDPRDADRAGDPPPGARHPSTVPPLRSVGPAEGPDPASSGPAGGSRTRDRGDDPGSVRLLVAVGDKPARWYRTPAEAVADARPLAGDAEPGDVVARAWTAEPAEGPPAWELRRGPRRRLRWERVGGGPGPGSA